MNRHFVYSAMTDTVLGTPIRREESKSRETPWVPTDTPGYVRRINSEGMPEVSHVDNLPKPAPELPIITILADCAAQAPEAATLGAEPAVSTPDAAHQWQKGAPPERGWYEASCYAASCGLASFWDGDAWTHNDAIANPSPGVVPDDGYTEFWRGPRLTGDRWPEPEAL
jgi:hypothetical protein